MQLQIVLLILLFCSFVSRKATFFLNMEILDALSFYTREWEYKFAVQICEQNTSMTWLPSLVMLLEQRGNSNVDQGLFLKVFLAMQFTLQKLKDPAFVFKLESGEDTGCHSDAVETYCFTTCHRSTSFVG